MSRIHHVTVVLTIKAHDHADAEDEVRHALLDSVYIGEYEDAKNITVKSVKSERFVYFWCKHYSCRLSYHSVLRSSNKPHKCKECQTPLVRSGSV